MRESFGVDFALLGLNRAGIERSRYFVGGFDRNGRGSRAGGTLPVVLRNSGLGDPLVAADNTPVAFHVLNEEHIVRVVKVGSGGSGFLANAGVNGGQLVELGLAWEFTLRLGSELRLVGQDVDEFPLGIGFQNERADVLGGGSPAVTLIAFELEQCALLHRR